MFHTVYFFLHQGSKLGPLRNHDIMVTIGQDDCTEISVAATLITCKPPPTQPHALVGSGLPEVIVSLIVIILFCACYVIITFCCLPVCTLVPSSRIII